MTKKTFLGLVSFLFLLVVLPLGLLSINQRQETRKQAEGQGLIGFSLHFTDEQNDEIFQAAPGATVNAQIRLANPQNLPLKTAGAEITFDQDVFSISTSSVSCDPSLPDKAPISGTSPGNIKLTCYQAAAMPPAAPTNLGGFLLTVKDNAPLGTTSWFFGRTRAPHPQTNEDLADRGNSTTLIIALPPTPSPSLPPTLPPTLTPTPSIRPTNTPIPTTTPIATPTSRVCMRDGSPCRNDTACCSYNCGDGYCEPILPPVE
jgi:hypothetical protein